MLQAIVAIFVCKGGRPVYLRDEICYFVEVCFVQIEGCKGGGGLDLLFFRFKLWLVKQEINLWSERFVRR